MKNENKDNYELGKSMYNEVLDERKARKCSSFSTSPVKGTRMPSTGT